MKLWEKLGVRKDEIIQILAPSIETDEDVVHEYVAGDDELYSYGDRNNTHEFMTIALLLGRYPYRSIVYDLSEFARSEMIHKFDALRTIFPKGAFVEYRPDKKHCAVIDKDFGTVVVIGDINLPLEEGIMYHLDPEAHTWRTVK